MPELPEVEIVVRRLGELIGGKTIVDARLYHEKLSPETTARQFRAWLRGARVEEVSRRGKHILAHLSNGRTLIAHLRMTGRFLYVPEDAENSKHTHAAFWFDDGMKLLFDDARRFGWMTVAKTAELQQVKPLAKLAPEPFSPEFSPRYLHETLLGTKQYIKFALLDQTRVAGLGNIYASEALHRAGISPRLYSCKLSKERAKRLHRAIVEVLGEAIANDVAFDAASDSKSRDLDTSYGRYQAVARVYEREGEPCLRCGALIRRITQGQRSTYYCPRCQRR